MQRRSQENSYFVLIWPLRAVWNYIALQYTEMDRFCTRAALGGNERKLVASVAFEARRPHARNAGLRKEEYTRLSPEKKKNVSTHSSNPVFFCRCKNEPSSRNELLVVFGIIQNRCLNFDFITLSDAELQSSVLRAYLGENNATLQPASFHIVFHFFILFCSRLIRSPLCSADEQNSQSNIMRALASERE